MGHLFFFDILSFELNNKTVKNLTLHILVAIDHEHAIIQQITKVFVPKSYKHISFVKLISLKMMKWTVLFEHLVSLLGPQPNIFLNRKRRWYPHHHHCGNSCIATLITTGVISVTSYPWPVVPFFSPTMLIPLLFSIL